jgi:F0F1-type ATP synthase delta subunit
MFLMDKSIARKKKAEAVKAIMGDLKMSVTTTQLFVVLAENGRMAEASKVIDMFAAQMMAAKGQVPAQVTSAEPLEKAELDELTKTLKGLIGKGETLLLTQKVHTSLETCLNPCSPSIGPLAVRPSGNSGPE